MGGRRRRLAPWAQALRRVRWLLAAGVWTVAMPALIRWLPFSRLLTTLTRAPGRHLPELEDVRLIIRCTDWLLRRLPFVPNTCLVRSLVLYRVLRGMGLPVAVVFGVRPSESGVAGHAWLTQTVWPDLPLGEAGQRFTTMYTFPQPVSE